MRVSNLPLASLRWLWPASAGTARAVRPVESEEPLIYAELLANDDVAAGKLATVLDHLPSHVFDTHALWPQTTHLPLRVRLAIDALVADLPEVTMLPLSAT